jgi:tetratricopeptide (TPR) repeat protein
MRSQLLLGSTFAATLAVAAFGFADPPPAAPARPAMSASVGFSTSAGVTAPAGSAGLSTRADARPKAGAGPSAAAIAKGHAAYTARDYPGAIQAYKEAIAQDGSDPASYYFLGEAQIAGGSTAEADASFAAGLRNVGNKDDVRGKLLFVVADLRERQGKWPEAKKAWEDYAQFLSTHPGVKGYQATATERVKVVDAHVDLDTKYAPVRQRIEQRVKENASVPAAADETPPPAPAPAKKK